MDTEGNLKVWVLTNYYGKYEQAATEIVGIFGTLEKAQTAADTALKADTSYIRHEWTRDKAGSYELVYDHKWLDTYQNWEKVDKGYGYYEIAEMEVL